MKPDRCDLPAPGLPEIQMMDEPFLSDHSMNTLSFRIHVAVPGSHDRRTASKSSLTPSPGSRKARTLLIRSASVGSLLFFLLSSSMLARASNLFSTALTLFDTL